MGKLIRGLLNKIPDILDSLETFNIFSLETFNVTRINKRHFY